MELVEAEKRRLPEDVNVFVKELGASSVDLGLRFWVPTDQYWPVRWQLLEDIKIRFDAEKISMKGKPSGFLFIFLGKGREKKFPPCMALPVITCYVLT